MRSRERLANPAARARSTAVRIWAAVWGLPRSSSSASEKDCAPSDSRVTPLARQSLSRSLSAAESGLASRVNSRTCEKSKVRFRARSTSRKLQSGKRLGVPPPKYTVSGAIRPSSRPWWAISRARALPQVSRASRVITWEEKAQ